MGPEGGERPDAPGPEAGRRPDRHEWWRLLTGRPGAAALAGLVSGLLIGGVGGRLAMFVLRLTSSDAVRGIESDDGFVIGQVTLDTVFLLLATTAGGIVLAVAYLIVRRWLPGSRRPLLVAVFFGITGGAAFIEPGGVDFTFLDPKPLAIAFFVLLPAAYGAAMVVATEWLIARPERMRGARVAALVVLLPLLIGPFALVAVAAVASVMLADRHPGLAGRLLGPVPTWTVRFALVALVGLGLIDLSADVSEIL